MKREQLWLVEAEMPWPEWRQREERKEGRWPQSNQHSIYGLEGRKRRQFLPPPRKATTSFFSSISSHSFFIFIFFYFSLFFFCSFIYTGVTSEVSTHRLVEISEKFFWEDEKKKKKKWKILNTKQQKREKWNNQRWVFREENDFRKWYQRCAQIELKIWGWRWKGRGKKPD